MREWQVPGYTELKELGSGGFGEVVLARHDPTGTLVAIKYLRYDLLADPEFAAMFRDEAATLASLEDPNVVRLYEYVEARWGAAIVMELIGGVSLREIIAYQGKTSAEAALVVLRGSLLGLAAAHRHGVVHRDYKPENVLVDGDGVSKLTDFGIAARAGDRPIPAGTVAYAAPEQMAGAPATPASDVYSATATFYECLVGRPPFGGDTADTVLRQHRAEPVPLEPVPEALRPLIVAGMAKEPAARPADAAILVDELQTVASGAYGQDWAERGRSHLGEAALLLAALWPAGAPPSVQGTTVERVALRERPRPRRSRGDRPHGERPPGGRPGRGLLRHGRLGAGQAALGVAVVVTVVAVGTALAGAIPHHPGSSGSSGSPAAPGGSAAPNPVVLKVPLPAGHGPQDITLTATSPLTPVSGDVYVIYDASGDASATLSGEITGAAPGEVARLYAQPFPFTSSPAPAGAVTLDPAGKTAMYSFSVTPTLATQYRVELFGSAAATTPLSISPATTVYVAIEATLSKGPGCSRPTCHETLTLTTLVPPQALATEMAKHWYTYFAVNLSDGPEPPAPTSLQLGAGDPSVTQPQRIAANEFEVIVTYTFAVNNGGYDAAWSECTKDTEAQDGIGLPGSHGCGAQQVPHPHPYLG